jgi:hypothetical protein
MLIRVSQFNGACRLLAHRVISLCCGGPVASPVTATTDFLAPDILNKCGRAVPALTLALGRTRCAKAINNIR